MYSDNASQPIRIDFVIFWTLFVIAIFVFCNIVGRLALAGAPQSEPVTRDETIPQTMYEIYTHYTVVSTQEDGVLWVNTIYADSSYTGACDGWDTENEEGQNCVLAGFDSIHEFIEYYNLPYSNVRGG